MEKPLNTLKNVNHYPQTTTQNLTCYTHSRQLEIVRSKQGFCNVPINEFHVNTEVLLYPSTAIIYQPQKEQLLGGQGRGKKISNS